MFSELSMHEVSLLRLMAQALSLACSVVQDIVTHDIVLILATGEQVPFSEGATAASWLRHYAHCGVYGRRCTACL